MEKIFEQVLLYDFYGELLTEHQRKVYEDAVCNDMSLGEIAQEYGISRQGVHDLIKRCDKILLEYESKLHLAERFAQTRKKVSEIVELAQIEPEQSEPNQETENDVADDVRAKQTLLQQRMDRIQELSRELLQEL